LCIILSTLLALSACAPEASFNGETRREPATSSSVTPSGSITPSVTPPRDDCATGHLFPDLSEICARCGIDYFTVTLEFKLTETKDSYMVSSVGKCDRSLIKIPETYKDLPVTQIGEWAFCPYMKDDDESAYCTGITGVVLPSTIQIIGESAFDSCINLKSIYIPEGVTEIGVDAFALCTRLTDIRLPQSLTTIGGGAFAYCQMREIEIPKNVTTVGHAAFSGCDKLVRLVLHDGITSLGGAVVMSCNSLESIYVSSAITEIGQDFAFDCPALKTVEFGGEIESIGICAFSGCESLETIDLGSKLESIPDSAFCGCTSLRSVIMQKAVTHIGEFAFTNCQSLRNIPISGELTSLGKDAFTGCSALYNVYEGFGYVGSTINPYFILASRVDPMQKNAVVHDDTRFVSAAAFANSDIESIYLGKSLDFVSPDTFEKMYALSQIQVSPENQTYHATGNCLIETESKTLVLGCMNSIIPNDGSVTVIGAKAFAHIKGLKSLVIPSTIVTIKGNAFIYCTDLEWLVIGSGVQTISHDQLIGCNKFSTIYYVGTQEEWDRIKITGKDAGPGIVFGGNKELLKATVYFYSETKPTEEGNFWHYVDGKPTPWKTEE